MHPPNSWHAMYTEYVLFCSHPHSVCVKKKTKTPHNKKFPDKQSTLREPKAGEEPTCLITGARDRGGISRLPNPTCQFILCLPAIIQRHPRAQCLSCVKSGGHKRRGGVHLMRQRRRLASLVGGYRHGALKAWTLLPQPDLLQRNYADFCRKL